MSIDTHFKNAGKVSSSPSGKTEIDMAKSYF
jgi:hypothetical protein